MRKALLSATVVLIAFIPSAAAVPPSTRTLDGSGNNLRHPDRGKVDTQYLRVAAPNYVDGIQQPRPGPATRYVSNRVFNDVSQNLFSENGVTQWGFVWGQFMDHTFGLRQQVGGEDAPIGFDDGDPLEEFENDFDVIPFARTPAAPDTGITTPRQQINTVSSYIDAWSVYGGTNKRLEWMREGPVDDDLANNGPKLLAPGGYLPRRDERGDFENAPEMELMGRLRVFPEKARVAGDVRANENIALLATHTLFALEHNRIVDALPAFMPDEERFQIARRVVGAEQLYVTYNEFLPALGVKLSPYQAYKPRVDASLGNEFAVVGYRAHSMIHGELEPSAPEGTWTDEQLEEFEEMGIEVEHEDGQVVLVIPLNLAFGNPDLLIDVGLDPVLLGLGSEPQYKNDEQIDNQLRSVLFQVPKEGADPKKCLDGKQLPECFDGVLDLGAIDIERGRDHGMPGYNALRKAYGLPPRKTFKAITGEATERFKPDPEVDPNDPINDPDILDFIELRNKDGEIIPLDSPEAESDAVVGIRRSALAARLRELYGNTDKLDAFVGMVSEKHVKGTEFGQLQLAIWKKQFQALRDGDRFFYDNDPELEIIERLLGITYKHTLAEIIELNTGVDVQPDVFKTAD